MLGLTVWLTGIFVRGLILYRGIKGKALPRYRVFFTYIASALLADCLLYIIRIAKPGMYAEFFWGAQFLTLALGCGILLEVFQHVLSPYPGAEKFARTVALIVFAAVFCFAILYPRVAAGRASASATTFELERDLRTVQAIFLFAVLAVISYYGITIGKNMKGMIYGYALYIATSLVGLAVHSYARPALRDIWDLIPPFSFTVSNVIWLIGMWTYHPEPAPEPDIHVERDYEAFAARTKDLMGTVRSHMARGARA